jgi:large subunit ribosomal protein L17
MPLQGNKTGQVLAGGIVRTERELHKLLTVMAERYKDRQGGYTRIVQLGRRQHDSAPMAYIE